MTEGKKENKIINYINDNVAAISIISATIIEIVVNILKIMTYCGQFNYFKISRTYINILKISFIHFKIIMDNNKS